MDHHIAGKNPALEQASASDLFERAVAHVRPRLDRGRPLAERLRAFWAGVKAARRLRTADVVAETFMQLAVDSGLKADLGYHAKQDLEHVIRWGMFARDPFGGSRRG